VTEGRRYVVYCLRDPLTLEIRYIGITSMKLSKRLGSHMRPRPSDRCHRTHWIASLRDRGLIAVIEPIETLTGRDQAAAREQYWIAMFRSYGFRLTNSTAGGEGMNDPCTETRLKLSVAMKGKKKSLEHAKAISAGKKGRPNSPEHIAKVAAAKRGRPGHRHTAESRAKLSASHKGRKFSDEHIANLRLSHLGHKPKPMTPDGKARMIAANTGSKRTMETRQRLSASLTGRKLSDEHRRNMSLAHQRRLASRKQSQNVTDP
jgi:hypothetical protein